MVKEMVLGLLLLLLLVSLHFPVVIYPAARPRLVCIHAGRQAGRLAAKVHLNQTTFKYVF